MNSEKQSRWDMVMCHAEEAHIALAYSETEQVTHTIANYKEAAEKKLKLKLATNDVRVKEYKELMHDCEEALSKLLDEIKLEKQRFTEAQKKVTDREEWLTATMKKMESDREEISRLMKEKELLMIANESNEADYKASCLSTKTKFLAVTSCVRWAFDGEEHEVKGCLVEPHKASVFDFDKREKSQFYICNKIWEMMEPADDWKDLASGFSTKCQENIVAHPVTTTYVSDKDEPDSSSALS